MLCALDKDMSMEMTVKQLHIKAIRGLAWFCFVCVYASNISMQQLPLGNGYPFNINPRMTQMEKTKAI